MQASQLTSPPCFTQGHTTNITKSSFGPNTKQPKDIREKHLLRETTCCGNPTFPFRLHVMLDEAEEKNFDHVVSWEGSQAFRIHDRVMFEKHVLPRYYFQTRYKSFLRQRKYDVKSSHVTMCSHDLTMS